MGSKGSYMELGLPSQTVELVAHAHTHGKTAGVRYWLAARLLWTAEKLLSQKVRITMEAK